MTDWQSVAKEFGARIPDNSSGYLCSCKEPGHYVGSHPNGEWIFKCDKHDVLLEPIRIMAHEIVRLREENELFGKSLDDVGKSYAAEINKSFELTRDCREWKSYAAKLREALDQYASQYIVMPKAVAQALSLKAPCSDSENLNKLSQKTETPGDGK